MEPLNSYITERIRIDNIQSYNYAPKNGDELQKLMSRLVKERGTDGDFNDIDTTEVENMMHLFDTPDLWKFNGHIEKWNVYNVANMSYMFCGCSKFNQDISGWKTENVYDMSSMFERCTNFNQDISGWDVTGVRNRRYIFVDCGIENKNKPKRFQR